MTEQTQTREQEVTWSDVWRYTALPQVRPRAQALIESGFQYIAFFIALVYQLVRLLPEGHPYTNAANMGRFGIRHVIAEAANHLTFSVKNIDQIIIFVLILIGMTIGLVQFATLLMSFTFTPVMAAMPTNFGEFFSTEDPSQDIAFMLMDLVFGIPDLFGSCISTGTDCVDLQNNTVGEGALHQSAAINSAVAFPFPIHTGLHNMFQIYSYGLLIVAAFITIYFIFVIFAETAQSGTPFGKRFNKVWAPIRIVAAFGLLIPIGDYGLNSSQYLVLHAAKLGSSFATKGWILFNNELTSSYLGEVDKLVASPNPPELGSLLQFLYVAKTCQEYYKLNSNIQIDPYLVRSTLSAQENLKLSIASEYEELVKFADGDATVTIRFGQDNDKDYALYRGFVKPLCGEMQFTLSDGREFSLANGTQQMESFYFVIFKFYFIGFYQSGVDYPLNQVLRLSQKKPDADATLPNPTFYTDMQTKTQTALKDAVDKAVEAEQDEGKWTENLELLKKRGWGGAAIWYNRIAEMNGALTTAILNVPAPTLYPAVMEHVRKVRLQTNSNPNNKTRYDPILTKGQLSVPINIGDTNMAITLYAAFKGWEDSEALLSTHTAPTGNMVIDIINGIFGTQGLFDMRKNEDVHPLAQLSSIGRSLIESAIQNIGLAVVGGISGVLSGALNSFVGATAGVAAGFLVTIATIGMTLGFVLFYILPFLPFIYFFFAVCGWVKGIFEAMVGAPLWALAHIRIDGNGLPGQAAVAGYFLIFEVFLRPILITFGLLASILIFSAMVLMLNETFDLVIRNLTGFNGAEAGNDTISMEMFRGPLDEFMFTIIYTVIVYLMAMSSFKLIDNIPNNILRWMGQNIQTFNDSREDPAQSLMSTAWLGGQQTFQALGGGLGKIANARGK